MERRFCGDARLVACQRFIPTVLSDEGGQPFCPWSLEQGS
jgi:hypothetical protein